MGILRGELDFDGALAGLLPHQRKFLGITARNAAYVGGQGSGKSVALCLLAILSATRDPGGFSLIGRLNVPALTNSTMKTFLELIPERYGEWKPSEKRFIFVNGHEIVFSHLDISDPAVAGHIKSMNLSAAYIDEATEISEEIYFLVDGRVRRRGTPIHMIRLASNPAGQDWVWRHFFNPHRSEALQDNAGINASTFDNVHLPAATVAHWKATYPADWAQRYLYGSFADFSDRVYKDFTERTHVWDARRWSPLPNWPVIIGVDIGGGEEGDPWAIALIAVAPNGHLYQYAEVYGSDLRIAPIASEIHAHVGTRHLDGLAYDYAQSAAGRELEEHDIGGTPAEKAVKPGLFKVAQYMHCDERIPHPFNADIVEGSPRFFVSSACTDTIRELTAYKWAKDRSGRPKFEPSHQDSHMPDAIRYAIHTFRPLPEREVKLEKWQAPGLDEMSRLYWYEQSKHQRDGEGAGAANVLHFARARLCRFRRPAMLRSTRADVRSYRAFPKER